MIIKVCSDNGVIDWGKIKNDPIEFAYIRTSVGLSIDSQLAYNVKNANDNNIKKGFYHEACFCSTDVTIDARDEANYFVKLLYHYMLTEWIPIVLRVDENKIKLNSIQVRLWISTFMDELKRNNFFNIALQSNSSFLNTNLPHQHDLGNIPVWIIGEPNSQIPNGWKDVWLWQSKDGLITESKK